MTLILLFFKRFTAFRTREEFNVMRHKNSVFHQIQQHIDWTHFDQLVDKHKADHRVRKLTTKTQFMALLFAQLSGADSLREIKAGLSSHKHRLYHLGDAACRAPLLLMPMPKDPLCFRRPVWTCFVKRRGFLELKGNYYDEATTIFEGI